MVENKREYWQEHIERYKKSSLSQQKYCQEKNLNYNTFKYWTVQIKKECKTETGLTKLPLQYNSAGNAFEIITRNNFWKTQAEFQVGEVCTLLTIIQKFLFGKPILVCYIHSRKNDGRINHRAQGEN